MGRRRWKLRYAAKFVGKWEGFLEVALLDTIASPPLWTIGFGHTRFAGAPVPHEGMRVTREQAEAILTDDLRGAARAVDAAIDVPLTFRQRIALISAAFNLGASVLDTLAPLINAGRMKAAADKLLEFNHAGGVVVEGLTNRRKAERWMMLHSLAPNPHRPQPHRKGAR